MRFTPERIKQEIVSPTRKITKTFLDFIHGGFGLRLKKNTRRNQKYSLIWDIRSNPVTFDFIWLIIATSNHVNKYTNKNFDVILYLPSEFTPKPFTFGNYNEYVSSEDIIQRIDDLIIPLVNAFNCVDEILVIKRRDELLDLISKRNIFPVNYKPSVYYPYSFDYPKTVQSLNKLEESRIPYLISEEYINPDVINDLSREYMTLTIRDYGFIPERNTTSDDIKAFSELADFLNVIPIIIPDEISKLKEYNLPSNMLISFDSRLSISKRIKLYSKSIVNIFTPSGPFYSSLFCRGTKSIVYNMKFFNGEKPGKYGYYDGDQPYIKLAGYILWRSSYKKLTFNELYSAYEILKRRKESL